MILATLILLQAAATTTTAPVPTAKGSQKPKLICRTTDTLGSRLGGSRTCLTASEWELRTRTDRQAVERIQSTNMRPSGN